LKNIVKQHLDSIQGCLKHWIDNEPLKIDPQNPKFKELIKTNSNQYQKSFEEWGRKIEKCEKSQVQDWINILGNFNLI